jgi:hypothetical protein
VVALHVLEAAGGRRGEALHGRHVAALHGSGLAHIFSA